MKTIKQIADELGVNKDKVKYRVRKLPASMVSVEEGITQISEDGERLLQGYFAGRDFEKTEKVSGEMSLRYVETLERELETKNRQIESQASQISNLSTALVATQQMAAAAQALHAATVTQTITANEKAPREKGILSRFFGKKQD